MNRELNGRAVVSPLMVELDPRPVPVCVQRGWTGEGSGPGMTRTSPAAKSSRSVAWFVKGAGGSPEVIRRNST